MRATRREEISNYLIYIKKEKEIFTMRKVKRIKNVLCVLLATIISLVSMTTVKGLHHCFKKNVMIWMKTL